MSHANRNDVFVFIYGFGYFFDAKVKAKPRNVFVARLDLLCSEALFLLYGIF